MNNIYRVVYASHVDKFNGVKVGDVVLISENESVAGILCYSCSLFNLNPGDIPWKRQQIIFIEDQLEKLGDI